MKNGSSHKIHEHFWEKVMEFRLWPQNVFLVLSSRQIENHQCDEDKKLSSQNLSNVGERRSHRQWWPKTIGSETTSNFYKGCYFVTYLLGDPLKIYYYPVKISTKKNTTIYICFYKLRYGTIFCFYIFIPLFILFLYICFYLSCKNTTVFYDTEQLYFL